MEHMILRPRRLTRGTLLVWSALVLWAATETPLQAQPPPPTRGPVELGARKGLQLQLGLGTAGVLQKDDLTPVLSARAHVLLRLARYVALGAHLAFGVQHERGSFSFYSSHTVWETVVGAELRLTFPIRRFELWLAGMAGYGRIQDDLDTDFAAAWEHGIATGLGAGGHYYLTDHFALGLDLWFSFLFPEERCLHNYPGSDGDVCVRILGIDPPVLWSVALTATWFIEFGRRRR